MGHSHGYSSITGLQIENGGNNAPLEVFCSAKIVLFTTVSETSYIAEVISSRANLLHGRVYPLIEEYFA